METIFVVIMISLIMAGAGAALGFALTNDVDTTRFLMVLLGIVGAVVGAVAGAAHEISVAIQRKSKGD